jgi:long-chain acyl-CoA synthetase
MAKIDGSPWVEHYDSGVSSHLNYPELTLVEILRKAADSKPDKNCIIYSSWKFTYKDIDNSSTYLAGNLVELGLLKSNRVGVLLGNTPAFLQAFFAILKAGCVVVAINPHHKLPEILYVLNDSDVTLVITDASHDDLAREIKQATGRKILVIPDFFPGLNLPTDSNINQEIVREKKNILESKDPVINNLIITPDDPAIFQYSGGTTGTPKAAIGSHRNLVANVIQFSEWLKNLANPNPIFFSAIPFYHVYGMVLALCLPIFMKSTLIAQDKFQEMDSTIALINQYKPDISPLVPTMFRSLIKDPHFGELHYGALKICISGSAPLDDSLKNEFEARTGATILEGYGLSEAPTATHCNPLSGQRKTGSIGLPLPDVNCRIVDMDNGDQILPIGEAGELILNGPQVMRGYHKRNEETGVVIQNGWLFTGDIARMDPDGYFYITGRKKELIKVNGLQVWPGEVENAIRLYPGISDVVVAGIPDAETGERPKAWIIPVGGVVIDVNTLRKFCKDYLAEYKIPREFEMVREFPRSNIGKVLRRELVRRNNEKKHPG